MNLPQQLQHIPESTNFPTKREGSWHPLPLIMFGTLLFLLTNCSWTPEVETMIETIPQGYVSLKTVTDDTFQAAHPINLSPLVIHRVLQGLKKQRKVRLLQTLVTGTSEETSILQPEEINLLVSPLEKAFAQATQEEVVSFHLKKTKIRPTPLEGTMFVDGNALVVNWEEAARGGKTKLDRTIKGDSGVVGVSSYTPRFSPKEAVIKDVQYQTHYIKTIQKHSLFIDYKKLATLSENVREDISQIQDTSNPSTPSDTNTQKFPIPRTSENPSTIQDLMRQMEELKKKLAEQQAEIENLKSR